MRVLFHTNQLSVRGTDVAVFDYAHFNESLLGNESLIAYDKESAFNDSRAEAKFSKRFRVFPYSSFAEIEEFSTRERVDVCYFMKAGGRDGKVCRGLRNAIHAVFQVHEPHGDVYAYISEWLSLQMTNGAVPFVPYIVRLPQPNENLRKAWGIPEDAIVFGRHGGYSEFDLHWVHQTVARLADECRNIYFVFLNTKQFCPTRRNIIHLPAVVDLQDKSNFIGSCDAMLHARAMGESFGLAIAEFLLLGKPVFAWREGTDKNHLVMLNGEPTLYDTEVDLYDKLSRFDPRKTRPASLCARVSSFSPETVMKKFDHIFLRGAVACA